ncbi:MAG: hypothetical protein COX42_01770, partial [Parcubacteria group bacterium CG23_combo_of_CG06-09_8_20_14_all_35_6]
MLPIIQVLSYIKNILMMILTRFKLIYRKFFKTNWVKTLGFCFLIGLVLASLLLVSYIRELPRPEKFTEKETAQSTKIYARDGETILYEIYG